MLSVLLLATTSVTGCSVFEKPEDPLERRFGGGIYRPEGMSADKEQNSGNLMRTLGLHRARRKDKDLAEKQLADAELRFESAQELDFEARKDALRDAAELYKKAASNWRSSHIEQDALLGAAECHFFAEDYYQAEQLYSQLSKEYPKNKYLDHVEKRKFEIADYWLKVDQVENRPFIIPNLTDRRKPWNDTGGHGKRALEDLRVSNPTGQIGDDATMRLAMHAFESADFELAAHTFSDIRSIYPDSEHVFNASFLELQSLLASYQGPDYSSIPLEEAEKRVKQIVRQFPVEAQGKQAELNEAYGQIRYLLAQRIWNQVDYYAARQENSAALFLANRILTDYSDTPFAEQARELTEQLKDKPPEPPLRFKFLADAFGETRDSRPWVKDE